MCNSLFLLRSVFLWLHRSLEPQSQFSLVWFSNLLASLVAEMLFARGVPQHLFYGSSSCQVQKWGEVLGILSFPQGMCKEDFSVFLDILQGLAEGKSNIKKNSF